MWITPGATGGKEAWTQLSALKELYMFLICLVNLPICTCEELLSILLRPFRAWYQIVGSPPGCTGGYYYYATFVAMWINPYSVIHSLSWRLWDRGMLKLRAEGWGRKAEGGRYPYTNLPSALSCLPSAISPLPLIPESIILIVSPLESWKVNDMLI